MLGAGGGVGFGASMGGGVPVAQATGSGHNELRDQVLNFIKSEGGTYLEVTHVAAVPFCGLLFSPIVSLVMSPHPRRQHSIRSRGDKVHATAHGRRKVFGI